MKSHYVKIAAALGAVRLLLEERPALAAKKLGSTTLGNMRIEAQFALEELKKEITYLHGEMAATENKLEICKAALVTHEQDIRAAATEFRVSEPEPGSDASVLLRSAKSSRLNETKLGEAQLGLLRDLDDCRHKVNGARKLRKDKRDGLGWTVAYDQLEEMTRTARLAESMSLEGAEAVILAMIELGFVEFVED